MLLLVVVSLFAAAVAAAAAVLCVLLVCFFFFLRAQVKHDIIRNKTSYKMSINYAKQTNTLDTNSKKIKMKLVESKFRNILLTLSTVRTHTHTGTKQFTLVYDEEKKKKTRNISKYLLSCAFILILIYLFSSVCIYVPTSNRREKNRRAIYSQEGGMYQCIHLHLYLSENDFILFHNHPFI